MPNQIKDNTKQDTITNKIQEIDQTRYRTFQTKSSKVPATS